MTPMQRFVLGLMHRFEEEFPREFPVFDLHTIPEARLMMLMVPVYGPKALEPGVIDGVVSQLASAVAEHQLLTFLPWVDNPTDLPPSVFWKSLLHTRYHWGFSVVDEQLGDYKVYLLGVKP